MRPEIHLLPVLVEAVLGEQVGGDVVLLRQQDHLRQLSGTRDPGQAREPTLECGRSNGDMALGLRVGTPPSLVVTQQRSGRGRQRPG
jgi:hypothetical protein